MIGNNTLMYSMVHCEGVGSIKVYMTVKGQRRVRYGVWHHKSIKVGKFNDNFPDHIPNMLCPADMRIL